MGRIVDIYHNVLPKWIHQLAPKNMASDAQHMHCVTETQLLHLGLPISHSFPFSFAKLVPPIDWCSACITQCRHHKYISDSRGEICDININSPHLSIYGKPLTHDRDSLKKLDEKQYRYPFWITKQECSILAHHLPQIFDYFSARGKFVDQNTAIQVLDVDGKPANVVNVEEVFSKSNSMSLLSCLSLFRPFEPFNVVSKKRFLPSTELLIRSECWRTRCWCSVWGTEEDFKITGSMCLDGAISITVFDVNDDETILTNALRTINSADAYRVAFPHHHLTFLS